MLKPSKAAHRAAVRAAAHATSGGHHAPPPPAKAAAKVIVQAKRPGDPVPDQPAWRMSPAPAGVHMDRFSHLTFPDYQYREHPKWVQPPSGPRVLVQNAEEEAVVMAGDILVREEEERARLVLLAEVKGVQVDATWPLDKIADAIEAAGHDPNLDPSA